MKVAVVVGSIPTSGSPYTVAGPSGFGLPEGLVLVCGAPGDSVDSVVAELWDHIGFASATAQTCEAAWVADNATSGTAGNYKRISYSDRIYTDDAEGVNIDAVNGAGPVTDGWELALDAAPGAAIPYVALLIGDTGGLAVGHAVDTAGAVTGLGFTPSFGMFATTGQDNDGSEDTVSTLGFGVVDSAGADYCHNLVKRSSTTNSIGEGRTGTMLAYKVLLTTDAWSLNFDSWDSGGFSFTDTSGDGDRFAYLVLDPNGATITVSVEVTPGATGDASFDPGHLVQAIFGKATTQAAWATQSQNAAAGAAAFFAADDTNEACYAVAAEHAANPTDTQHELAGAVFDVPADTGTAGQITGTVTDVSDVTINFTSANALGFLLVAFEAEAGGAIETGVGTETDSALTRAVSKQLASGIAAATEAALTTQIAKNADVGAATELDAALASALAKQLAGGVAAESDAAQGLTITSALATLVAAETDSAVERELVKTLGVGLAAETDAAQDLVLTSGLSPGAAPETDTATAPSVEKQIDSGVAHGTDVALILGVVKPVAALPSIDTSVALSLALHRALAAGSATESDVAMGSRFPLSTGLAADTESALALELASAVVGPPGTGAWTKAATPGTGAWVKAATPGTGAWLKN